MVFRWVGKPFQFGKEIPRIRISAFELKTTAKLLAVFLLGLILCGYVVWEWSRPVPFGVRAEEIEVRTKPSLAVIGSPPIGAAMVAPDGTLWGWRNSSVDMGVPVDWRPRRLSEERDWKKVIATYSGVLALKKDGSLWAIGNNGEGSLGSVKDSSKLVRMGTDSDWKDVAAGVAHCLALKNDGTLWGWGQNRYGQVGMGSVTGVEPPTQIGSDTNWLMIGPGSFSSHALKRDGSLWEWGSDALNQTTPEPTQNGEATDWTEISVGNYHIIGRKRDGTVWIKGPNANYMVDNPSARTNWVRLESATNWVEMYSGQNVTIAKRADGSWETVGKLVDSGRVTLPTGLDPLAIHTDGQTTLMLMKDGRLWSLGYRAGMDSKITFLDRLDNWSRRLLGKRSFNSRTYAQDGVPMLIWEAGGTGE
jgi:alpha-tubulin suppressor-like RCC1 family protein